MNGAMFLIARLGLFVLSVEGVEKVILSYIFLQQAGC